MVMIRRGACAAFAAAAALILSGCVAPAPAPAPQPDPPNTPIFATDEEALAAAEQAFGEYLAMTNLIAQEGGASPERIAPFVTEEWLATELEGFRQVADAGRHQTGETTFDSMELQQSIQDALGASVVVNVCLDRSARQSIDSTGQIVNLEHIPPRLHLEVTAETTDASSPSDIKISGIERWSESSC